MSLSPVFPNLQLSLTSSSSSSSSSSTFNHTQSATMRYTAILSFLALTAHPLTALAQGSTVGDLLTVLKPTVESLSCKPANLYCCAGVDGPGTSNYDQIQSTGTDPGAAVGTNCNRINTTTGQCDSAASARVCCSGSFGENKLNCR
ncbi:hypothetical protein BO86DRAFT_399805 [Aspergillus japonicus CBS 114.51]|uniref:Hydrophobin n=1 Tax=Aspergillus japonicus CBS 114.51 TaxID=1448312 RepID=A0A8T8X211_ASPJA|nr:hypothetical protein BO86DRAFT_399805 [Aspergillus japonicus CBS 114.51]RAH81672.1 hypothetical protein BO86DRAFT_399805 [Aspergillus japonicus CBS 114.51]